MCNNIQKMITFYILICFLLFNSSAYAVSTETNTSPATSTNQSTSPLPTNVLDIASPSAILIDAKTGIILFEKNSTEKMYPASITKIMTAILAFEKGDLDSTITMSHKSIYDIEPGSSNAGFLEGETLTLEQSLYALLIWSANESANAIAEQIGGTRDDFIKMMNQRAKELGATNTNFVNPNGLHNLNHYTTAHDMAMITRYAMSIPMFKEIVKTLFYTIPPTNKMPKSKELHNKNQLLIKSSKYYYKNAIGVKTGYTIAAGSTLVSAASKDNMELIAVVLNSPIQNGKSCMYTDSINMFNYGFDNFIPHKVLNKNEIMGKLKVTGSRKKVSAIVPDDVYVLLPKGNTGTGIKVTKQLYTLNNPVKKDDIVGYVNFKQNNIDLGNYRVVASNDSESVSGSIFAPPKEKTVISMTLYIFKCIGLILLFILGIVLLLIGVFIIYGLIYTRIIRKRKNKYRM